MPLFPNRKYTTTAGRLESRDDAAFPAEDDIAFPRSSVNIGPCQYRGHAGIRREVEEAGHFANDDGSQKR